MYIGACPEDAPALVIDVIRIPFEMIILYGSVLCTWVGSGLWSTLNWSMVENMGLSYVHGCGLGTFP